MSASRDKGTKTESAVARVFRANGWPNAERRAPRGSQDCGDITGCPGICVEAKGGNAAETASDGQVAAWLEETEKERRNAGADVGVLVLKRKGVGYANAERWWAVLWISTILELHTGPPVPAFHDAPARLMLSDVLTLLRKAGYGDAH